MKLTLGFSPCPNDTFIFDALVNRKIDTEGLEFEMMTEDVQTLNEWAIQQKTDITKISYASLPLILDNYIALNSGSALGKGVGPLLISKIPIPEAAIRQCVIAIPGQQTTANLLFSLAFPEASNKVFLRYDKIEDFVAQSDSSLENVQGIKLGVIIHENRFTYEKKGLLKVVDLGEYWETETGLPIPLGGIIIKRTIDRSVQLQVDKLIRKSIEFAFLHYPELSEFVKEHAQEMEDDIMRKHIDLYVNDFSIDLGNEGRNAVKKFIEIHSSINKIGMQTGDIFIS